MTYYPNPYENKSEEERLAGVGSNPANGQGQNGQAGNYPPGYGYYAPNGGNNTPNGNGYSFNQNYGGYSQPGNGYSNGQGSSYPNPYATQNNGYNNQYAPPNNGYNNPYQTQYPNGAYYNPYTQQYYTYPVAAPKKSRWGLTSFLSLVVVCSIMAGLYFGLGVGRNQNGVIIAPEENADYGFTVVPNDPLYNDQYALQRINAEAAWAKTKGKESIIVAVLDTGVDAEHPDLQGKLVPGYDFVKNDDTPEDTVGHGTFVASIIAARADDNNGITGLAPNVKIMPLKVIELRGGDSSIIARAVRYAADNGARVINMSLGSPLPSRSIQQAVQYANSKGVVVVAASGNSGSTRVEYPSGYPEAISVGATGSTDQIARFSTHNASVDIAAPGTNILGARSSVNRICVARNGEPYCMSSGTSFSAPYVAATAALMLSVKPGLSPEQVKQILEDTATDEGTPGRDDYYGAGLLNAGLAVETAAKTP